MDDSAGAHINRPGLPQPYQISITCLSSSLVRLSCDRSLARFLLSHAECLDADLLAHRGVQRVLVMPF